MATAVRTTVDADGDSMEANVQNMAPGVTVDPQWLAVECVDAVTGLVATQPSDADASAAGTSQLALCSVGGT